jgi:hypothetical protein
MEVVFGASMEAGNVRCRLASRYAAPSRREAIRVRSGARRGGLPRPLIFLFCQLPSGAGLFRKSAAPNGEARVLEQYVNDWVYAASCPFLALPLPAHLVYSPSLA